MGFIDINASNNVEKAIHFHQFLLYTSYFFSSMSVFIQFGASAATECTTFLIVLLIVDLWRPILSPITFWHMPVARNRNIHSNIIDSTVRYFFGVLRQTKTYRLQMKKICYCSSCASCRTYNNNDGECVCCGRVNDYWRFKRCKTWMSQRWKLPWIVMKTFKK